MDRKRRHVYWHDEHVDKKPKVVSNSKELYHDITIKTNDGVLYTSSFLLCHLEYYRTMFSFGSITDKPIIHEIKFDCTIDKVSLFLDSIHSIVTNVPKSDRLCVFSLDNISSIYRLADYYRYQPLLDDIALFIKMQRFSVELYKFCLNIDMSITDELWAMKYMARIDQESMNYTELDDLKSIGFFDSEGRVTMIFDKINKYKLKMILKYCLFQIDEDLFLKLLKTLPDSKIYSKQLRVVLQIAYLGAHPYMRHVLLHYFDTF